jgi:hypothetical protein
MRLYGHITRIDAWRLKVQFPPELHSGEACKGILNNFPGIKVLNVYVISTWFRMKLGASGSAGCKGLPAAAVLHPELVQVSQLERRLAPVPFTPELAAILIGLHTRTDAPVGFQRAPVMSWKVRYVTEDRLVVGDAPPEDGKTAAAGVDDPIMEYKVAVLDAPVRLTATRRK